MESEKRNQLIEDGYCILENILDVSSRAERDKPSLWTIDKMLADEPEHFDRKRSQGCVIPYSKYPHPVFTNLIADPRALKALALLGFDNPKVWTGFVISKPPYSPTGPHKPMLTFFPYCSCSLAAASKLPKPI